MSQLRRIRKRKSERALEGGQDCVAQRNLLGGRGLGPSRAPPWQGLFPHFMGGVGCLCVPSELLPPCPVQVWKYPKVWEGFIKCCQRTKPQSFQVILQLPPQQLGAVFDKCPELREPLLAHVRSFTPHQVPQGGVGWVAHASSPGGLEEDGQRGALPCHQSGTLEGQGSGVSPEDL